MKHLNLKSFVLGIGTTILVAGLSVTALAASGQLTLTVDPINIQVNGATFQPKDAKGNSVPVFAYNGTTYAPLRALAEAYGLEVGYDAGNNMATVGKSAVAPTPTPTATPDTPIPAEYSDWTAEEEHAYQEFKGMWEVESTGLARDKSDTDKYNAMNKNAKKILGALSAKSIVKFTVRMAREQRQTHDVMMRFVENEDPDDFIGVVRDYGATRIPFYNFASIYPDVYNLVEAGKPA